VITSSTRVSITETCWMACRTLLRNISRRHRHHLWVRRHYCWATIIGKTRTTNLPVSLSAPFRCGNKPGTPDRNLTFPRALAGLMHNREKQEIKTVRIVKRESERRQRDRGDRTGNIGIPLTNGLQAPGGAKRLCDDDLGGSQKFEVSEWISFTNLKRISFRFR